MRVLALFPVILSLASCNDNSGTKAAKQKSLPKDTIKGGIAETDHLPAKRMDTIPYNIQVDTVINFAFAPDNFSLTARGSINKSSHPVTCYLPVETKCRITASIIPDDNNLNIRFSRIIMPDNTSDGPFTRQLKYDLVQQGVYKLIIAPNNMADGKRSGDFMIRLQVK